MLHKTRGIVFKCTDFSESSVVVQIFTEKFGLQSYLINGVKKPKAKITKNILQPLHLLDMVVYHKPNGGVQRVTELRHCPVFQTIPYDIIKTSVTVFINEVLYQSVKQQEGEKTLFDFLFYAIEWYDRTEKVKDIFHLYFLLQLTRYLGFYPDCPPNNISPNYFDLQEGTLTTIIPNHPFILEGRCVDAWLALLHSSFDNLSKIELSSNEKKQLLKAILHYYHLHIPGFTQIKSHRVLQDIFN